MALTDHRYRRLESFELAHHPIGAAHDSLIAKLGKPPQHAFQTLKRRCEGAQRRKTAAQQFGPFCTGKGIGITGIERIHARRPAAPLL